MIKQFLKNVSDQRGFTIVEVMISLLMSSLIIIAVYNSAKTQQDTYVAQDNVVIVQQNLRAAMLLMVKEIRKAGYDPDSSAGAGITAATSNTFTFTFEADDDGEDNDGDAVVDEPNELDTVSYFLYTAGGIQKLGRQNPTATRPVAEYIANLEYYYTLEDGTQTLAPADVDDIRAVQVTVLARAIMEDEKFNATASFTSPSGAVWTLPADVRGRMLTVTLQCRNMGLE